jgi:peptidoglycan LD-endopeptidase CwlK
MPSRKLEDCDPRLVEKYALVKADYEALHPERTLFITCTYRTLAEQYELWQQGRGKPGMRVTNCDGRVVKSKHNYSPSRAIDVAVTIRGGVSLAQKATVSWDKKLYEPLLEICRAHGLVSGGTWGDWPHMELPGDL